MDKEAVIFGLMLFGRSLPHAQPWELWQRQPSWLLLHLSSAAFRSFHR